MADERLRPTGSDDEASVSRRGFLGWAVGLTAGFAALVGGIPVVGAFFGTSGPAGQGTEFVQVAELSALPVGEPTGITFVQQGQDAYVHEILPHSIWVLKNSETDVTVFSPVCPHLGCQVVWSKDKKQFICPCHNSTFSAQGAVLGGPAPRPLDTLPTRIEQGMLLVSWVNYQPGLSTKVPV